MDWVTALINFMVSFVIGIHFADFCNKKEKEKQTELNKVYTKTLGDYMRESEFKEVHFSAICSVLAKERDSYFLMANKALESIEVHNKSIYASNYLIALEDSGDNR